MARLPNKSTTARAPQTGSAWPEMPDLDAQLSEIDGGRTNAALQRWSDLVRQRVNGNEQQDDGRFRNIQTTVSRASGYLESVWTMEAIAGPVVTGMTLFSSTDPDTSTTVSRVTFQADIFQIQTASGNHKQIFSTSADAIKLGDVLTVDLVNAKVFIGTGTYGNANTAFYVDSAGNFSLKNKLTFNGSTLTIDGNGTFSGTITASAGAIGGWAIGPTTISANNAILDSTGQLVLGTSNDVVYLSATDATYRIWIGNAAAGSAAFRVTKAGVMTATGGVFSGSITSTSGTIGGFTISAGGLSAGGMAIPSTGNFVTFYGTNKQGIYGADGLEIYSTASAILVKLYRYTDTYNRFNIDTDGVMSWGPGNSPTLDTNLYRIGANTLNTDDNFVAQGTCTTNTGFVGSGASITLLNASNISSGTIGNSYLPAAIAVTSLQTSYFESGLTTATDIKNGNLRVYNGGTQTARIDYTTGYYYVQGNQVVGARGTKGAGTITEVVALLDAWGAWA